MTALSLRRVTAGRYVQPLREGGSLPAVVDTEGGLFVVKFRGAGQGPRALVAELLVGLIAARLGLAVPELALVEVPAPFGRSEPDPEIQDLLRRSHGLNVGLRYLDGAFNFDASAAARAGHPGVRGAPGLARRPGDQPRSDPPEPQPADLGAPALADRPRRRAVHPPRLGRRDRRAGAGAFPLIARHVLLARSDGLETGDETSAPRAAPTGSRCTRSSRPCRTSSLPVPSTPATWTRRGSGRDTWIT